MTSHRSNHKFTLRYFSLEDCNEEKQTHIRKTGKLSISSQITNGNQSLPHKCLQQNERMVQELVVVFYRAGAQRSQHSTAKPFCLLSSLKKKQNKKKSLENYAQRFSCAHHIY